MTDSKLIKKCEDVLMREGYTEIGEVLSKLLTRFKALSTGKDGVICPHCDEYVDLKQPAPVSVEEIVIPDWILDYDKKNYHSSAGRAIRELLIIIQTLKNNNTNDDKTDPVRCLYCKRPITSNGKCVNLDCDYNK